MTPLCVALLRRERGRVVPNPAQCPHHTERVREVAEPFAIAGTIVVRMWALRNSTPYGVGSNWIRDVTGAHWWLVAVRATFVIERSGKLVLDDEQPPPVLQPEYRGEAGLSSLRRDSDLLGLKPTTDVVVEGNAHAPKGHPTSEVLVALRAGTIEKRLIVYGDRVYYDGASGLTTTAPRPFVVKPLVYEAAFGGTHGSPGEPGYQLDERNPVGRGFAPTKALIEQSAHTIEYTSGDVSRRGPAGLGPIDAGWLPRRTWAGTYDAQWVATRKPLLPEDFDDRFHGCAPLDQRTATPMLGGERVGVLNMSSYGPVTFELPRIGLRFASWFGSVRTEHAPPTISTVALEPEVPRCSVTWQSALRVAAKDGDFLDATQIDEVRAS